MLRKAKSHADTYISGMRHTGVPPAGIQNSPHNCPEKAAEGKLHYVLNVVPRCFFEHHRKSSRVNYGSKNKSPDRKTQTNSRHANKGAPLQVNQNGSEAYYRAIPHGLRARAWKIGNFFKHRCRWRVRHGVAQNVVIKLADKKHPRINNEMGWQFFFLPQHNVGLER